MPSAATSTWHYIIENNGCVRPDQGAVLGVRGRGTKAKKGEVNQQPPIDPVLLALTLGATLWHEVSPVTNNTWCRSSGCVEAQGFALIDVLSPCSPSTITRVTKSYEYTREHYDAAVQADFVPFQREISADYPPGDVCRLWLHDGTGSVLRKLEEGYDPPPTARRRGRDLRKVEKR